MSDIKLKYGDDNISLDGNLRPSFSDDISESFYSFPQIKPKYITTERYFPSVEKQYNINVMKKTDRDLLYAFWNEKLSYGENMFTLIDHRQRCLFNALWDTFGAPETWQANRNAHNLTIKIQNPFGWTLPFFGAFLFENNILEEYLGTGINISTSSENDRWARLSWRKKSNRGGSISHMEINNRKNEYIFILPGLFQFSKFCGNVFADSRGF
jgi:hypothetical protein